MPRPGRKGISHCDPAYSQLAVITSMPNCISWSISCWMNGTYVLRVVLKMW